MNEFLIEETKDYVRDALKDESNGHDYFHALRVFNNANNIAQDYKCDLLVVRLAALLHDVDDYKILGGVVGQFTNAQKFLLEKQLPSEIIDQVCDIINKISFKGDEKLDLLTLEGKIVQDADRLDAIGVMGIVRVFAFAGYYNEKIYDPSKIIDSSITAEKYKKHDLTTIEHFYVKLLKLKDLMNTKKGKEIAEDRHHYMVEFLNRFYTEWEGKN